MTFEFDETESFKYVRVVQDEEYPDCPYCMQINQLELYGKKTDDGFDSEVDESDESVSIIGKVNKRDY